MAKHQDSPWFPLEGAAWGVQSIDVNNLQFVNIFTLKSVFEK